VAPFVFASLPYDTARDLAAITPLANLPTVLVTPASKGFKTVHDLVAAAKAKPGSINFTSAAASTQLNAERFRRSANFEAVHIAFKGAAEALNEVIAGRVDFYFSPIAPALPHIRDGRVVALAVGSAKRAAILPDVPTTLEAGFADSDYNFWIGLFAPARTPRDIIHRLHHEASSAFQSAEIRERLTRLGAEPMSMTPEQFDAHVKEELRLNGPLVKAAGITGN
jgi:tripartite-type tricarboxylate transporter receptor subunit TctC